MDAGGTRRFVNRDYPAGIAMPWLYQALFTMITMQSLHVSLHESAYDWPNPVFPLKQVRAKWEKEIAL